MTSVPEICRQTGYVFPEGVCLGETTTGVKTEDDVYRVRLESDVYNGEALLEPKYVPASMKPLTGKTLENLVVIRYEGGNLFVAADHYFDVLANCFYKFFYKSDGYRVKQKRFQHWEEAWAKAFSKDVYSPTAIDLHERKYRGQRWFEVKGADCRLPVPKHPHIEDLDGHPSFFPGTLYTAQAGWAPPRCIYKADDQTVDFPISLKATVRAAADSQKEKIAHCFVHGFTSPAKWHYGVLKHMLCIAPYGNPKDKAYWAAFEGAEVKPIGKKYFADCEPKYKKNGKHTSCNESLCLKKGIFETVHNIIRPLCHRYQRHWRYFLIDNPLCKRTIKVWRHQNEEFEKPKIVEFEYRREINVGDNPFQAAFIQEGEIDRKEVIALRGISYDWHDAAEPTIHLSILTLYSGKVEEKYQRKFKDERFTDYEPIFSGEIVAIG